VLSRLQHARIVSLLGAAARPRPAPHPCPLSCPGCVRGCLRRASGPCASVSCSGSTGSPRCLCTAPDWQFELACGCTPQGNLQHESSMKVEACAGKPQPLCLSFWAGLMPFKRGPSGHWRSRRVHGAAAHLPGGGAHRRGVAVRRAAPPERPPPRRQPPGLPACAGAHALGADPAQSHRMRCSGLLRDGPKGTVMVRLLTPAAPASSQLLHMQPRGSVAPAALLQPCGTHAGSAAMRACFSRVFAAPCAEIRSVSVSNVADCIGLTRHQGARAGAAAERGRGCGRGHGLPAPAPARHRAPRPQVQQRAAGRRRPRGRLRCAPRRRPAAALPGAGRARRLKGRGARRGAPRRAARLAAAAFGCDAWERPVRPARRPCR
jgi:hypothetical protein